MTLPVLCPECGSSLTPVGFCPRCAFAPASPSPESSTEAPHLLVSEGAAEALPRFGAFELIEPLADKGGMGVVYRARYRPTRQLVALKLLRPECLLSEEKVGRFQREARAMASLDHPNILPVYEVGRHHGQHYFSMKLIEQGSLDTQIRAGRWRLGSGLGPAGMRSGHEPGTAGFPAGASPTGMSAVRFLGSDEPRPWQQWIATLLEAVARAVHHAHARGILHRDLKPANILVDGEDHPYVADFGLAKLLFAQDAAPTRSQVFMGTVPYACPEQIHGRNTDLTIASDVWGRGVILCELLTGALPFPGETTATILEQIQRPERIRPRLVQRAVDRDLETICLRCLEREPQRRYPNAGEVANELQRYLEGAPLEARPISPGGRLWKWIRREPILAGGIGAALDKVHLFEADAAAAGDVLPSLGRWWLRDDLISVRGRK